MFGDSDRERAVRLIERQFQAQAKAINDLSRASTQHEQIINQLIAYTNSVRGAQMDHLESAGKYNSIILGLGYAGYFGLWGLTPKELGVWHSLSLLFIATSLTIFIFWEVYQMVIRTIVSGANQGEWSQQSTIVRVSRWCDARINKAWPWCLIPTVIFGLAGMGSLMFVLIKDVWHRLL